MKYSKFNILNSMGLPENPRSIRYLSHYNIGLSTKWLRILWISPNDEIRNHLVANKIPYNISLYHSSLYVYYFIPIITGIRFLWGLRFPWGFLEVSLGRYRMWTCSSRHSALIFLLPSIKFVSSHIYLSVFVLAVSAHSLFFRMLT